jgi:hypothetical protein
VGNGTYAYVATELDGTFEFPNIAPGDYKIETESYGTANSGTFYPSQWYDRTTLYNLAETVNISSTSEAMTIQISVDPTSEGAVLRGTVVTEANPDTPIPDVEVQLFAADASEPIDSGISDENGVFEIDDLPSGTYKLRTRSSGISGLASQYPEQWYEQVRFADQARTFNLQQGQTTDLIVPLSLEPAGQFITPAGGTAYLEVDGNLDDKITIEFPANAVSETINIGITMVTTDELASLVPPVSPPTSSTIALFNVNATIASTGAPVHSLDELIRVTLKYDDPEDLEGPPALDEETLAFIYWDDAQGAWIDPTAYPPCRLSPEIPACQQSVDTEANELIMSIDHLSLFGATGQDEDDGGDIAGDSLVYLPLINR